MPNFSLCITALLLLVSTEISANKSIRNVNSPINFANKIEELLKSESNGISPTCERQLELYRRSLVSGNEEDAWALQMFDAGAKLPAGLLEGNVNDFGSFDECINVEAEVGHADKLFGKYCLGTIPIDLEELDNRNNKQRLLMNNPIFQVTNAETRMMTPSGKTGIQLGKCLPDACSAADIERIYSGLGMIFPEELCQTKSLQPKLDGGSIATISFLGVVLWLMLVSTAYAAVLHYFEKKPHYPILIAFSVLTNGRKIIATSDGPNQISCLHGIRVISTMWVIISHRYTIQNGFPSKNYLEVANWMNDQANMFILGATVSVDTFFLLAGLVMAYTYMAAITKGIKFNIIMYYVHRYLRLTPVLAVIMIIHITLLRHLGSGPLWPYVIERDLITGCEKYWWKTMLYIQNYGNQDALCIPQSWYLSVDTQLFVLAPVLLIPLSRWPMFTLSATGFLTACSILTCFLTGWFFELNSSPIGNWVSGEQSMNYMRHYYMATQTRAAPWLIGLILGYAIFRVKQRKTQLVIHKAIIFMVWATSLAVLCTCVFAGHDLIFGKYDRVANSLHLAFVRPAWAVALGFIIFACVIGYGGPVNWFLSLPAFEVVSKLTYTLYLTHYTVIYFKTAQMRDSPRFSNGEMMYVFWGDFIFTMVIALVLTLAFESPIITIEKVLFAGSKKKDTSPATCEEYKTKAVKTPQP